MPGIFRVKRFITRRNRRWIGSKSSGQSVSLIGSSSGTGASTSPLKVDRALVGSGSSVGSASAPLKASRPLTGSGAATGSNSNPEMLALRRIAGTGACVGAVGSAAVLISRLIVGEASGIGVGLSRLNASWNIIGSGSGQGMASAVLRAYWRLVGAASAIAGDSADIHIGRGLSGLATATFNTSGQPQIHQALTGAGSAEGHDDLILRVLHSLIGSATGISYINGSIFTGILVSIAGDSYATGNATGNPRLLIGMMGAAEGQAGTLAHLIAAWKLRGNAAATGHADANLHNLISLLGVAAGLGFSSGLVGIHRPLGGSAHGIPGTFGQPQVHQGLLGSAITEGNGFAVLTIESGSITIQLVGSARAIGEVAANLSILRDLAGTAFGRSLAEAHLRAIFSLEGDAEGIADVLGILATSVHINVEMISGESLIHFLLSRDSEEVTKITGDSKVNYHPVNEVACD